MTTDVQQRIGSSLVQHGKASDRVYVMEIHDDDMPELIERIGDLAAGKGYSKLFAKVPDRWAQQFDEAGYSDEAIVPGFFSGREDGHFMAKYLCPERRSTLRNGTTREILRAVLTRSRIVSRHEESEGYVTRRCGRVDLSAMATLYRLVFPSYPFPIHDVSFLEEAMNEHVAYFGAWHEDELVALASAEKYPNALAAEMSDFATRPEHRRKGLALSLLRAVENHAREEGHLTAYTIARALSLGMNLTFAKGGYSFAGTLINNTQISGKIESMNVWFKPLSEASDQALSEAM